MYIYLYTNIYIYITFQESMGSEFDDDFEDSMQLYSTSRCFKWLWLATWNPLPVELGRSPFLCKELQTKLLFVHVPNVHSRPSQPAPTITRLQESVMLTRTIYIITNIYVYIYILYIILLHIICFTCCSNSHECKSLPPYFFTGRRFNVSMESSNSCNDIPTPTIYHDMCIIYTIDLFVNHVIHTTNTSHLMLKKHIQSTCKDTTIMRCA